MTGEVPNITEDLVSLLNQSGVSRPQAGHAYDCRYWREGKSHGPCSCGGRELDARVRMVLVEVGVEIQESPAQMHERESLTATGLMCITPLHRADGTWICDGCGWKKVMP